MPVNLYPPRPYPRLADVQAKMAYDDVSVKEIAAKAGLGYSYVVRLLNGYSYSAGAVERLRKAVDLEAPKNGEPWSLQTLSLFRLK